MTSKYRQGGWSFLSLLTVLLVTGVFVTVGFKLAPAYADNQTLKSVMQASVQDQQLMSRSKRDIRSSLLKKMRINNLSLPDKAIKITKEKGDVFFDIDYEIRIPMFANVEAVVMFKEQYMGRELD